MQKRGALTFRHHLGGDLADLPEFQVLRSVTQKAVVRAGLVVIPRRQKHNTAAKVVGALARENPERLDRRSARSRQGPQRTGHVLVRREGH